MDFDLGECPDAPVILGAKSVHAQQMGGKLDEIAVWERVLPAKMIARMYNQGAGGPILVADADEPSTGP